MAPSTPYPERIAGAERSLSISSFLESFQRDTAEIDWCEPNYQYSPHIAEFYNTVSNILFLSLPPTFMYLFHASYARRMSMGCHVVWALMMMVGIGSTYYHATLSLFGQLWDELGILWVIMAAFGMWIPKNYLPMIFKYNRRRLQVALLVITIAISCLSWIAPFINSMALMLFGLPITYIMVNETRRTTNARAYQLGVRAIWTWFFALSCWVTDRVMCPTWLNLGFPYMHSFWHLCVAITAHQACVLCAYYDTLSEELGDYTVHLRFWPSTSPWDVLTIPYVSIEPSGDAYKSKMEHV